MRRLTATWTSLLLEGSTSPFRLGSITNELLTNSLKHAFAGRAKGAVQVALRNAAMMAGRVS